jgi:hypothetical protein
VDQNITARDYNWVVPEQVTEQALLGVVAVDELGVMGSRVTNVFEIINGSADVNDGVPAALSLRFAGNNPAPRASLRLGMPSAGEASVRIYDVRGALVRELSRGTLEPGWHSLTWDGSGASGSRAEPGMYFVHVNFHGHKLLKRFVLLK